MQYNQCKWLYNVGTVGNVFHIGCDGLTREFKDLLIAEKSFQNILNGKNGEAEKRRRMANLQPFPFMRGKNVHSTTWYRCHKQLIKNQCCLALKRLHMPYAMEITKAFVFIAIAQHISFSIWNFITLTLTQIHIKHTAATHRHTQAHSASLTCSRAV